MHNKNTETKLRTKYSSFLISILCPFYNEEEALTQFFDEMIPLMEASFETMK